MATQLRCDGTLYGVISDDLQTIEVKCKRRSCGAERGVIILHTLSIKTGQVISTRRFKEPYTRKV